MEFLAVIREYLCLEDSTTKIQEIRSEATAAACSKISCYQRRDAAVVCHARLGVERLATYRHEVDVRFLVVLSRGHDFCSSSSETWVQ